ncbi:MFS transporter [Actinoallomurus rhizosphaericola]|uniref:MFS transporter n=1 Tax=Actinoallomurus rhizosphaericola TaxID=2952536 RepID=UPI002093990C|nr:MFS transporter [Actinoallomurus rhizosphaericola]MCO6000167.1 MFS transporter [Actinoallomurus rhizosphaericola]
MKVSAVKPRQATPARRHPGPDQPSGPRRPLATFGVVIASIAVAFGAGAGSPLFVLYQHEWGFPAWQLTTAFTVYAVTLLATLLVAGSVSDHIGRRPVLVGAMFLLLVTGALFLAADGIGWIIAARAVQGMATGAATSTFTAAIIELAGPRHRRVMTVLTSAAPVGGLALGALFAGLAVQTSDHPTAVVFIGLAVVLVYGIASVLAAPETADRHPGVLASLRPRLSVVRTARGWFWSLAPLIGAGWMFSGLFLGLAPSFDNSVFGIHNAAVNGAIVAIQPMAAALAGVAFGRLPAERATRVGALLVFVGAVLAVAGIAAGDLPLVVLGALLGGSGQGAAFGSSLRILGPLADNASRGGLFAAVYLVAYTAYGAPVLLAGIASDFVPLTTTVVVYGMVVALLAATAALSLTLRARRGERPLLIQGS